MTTPVCTCPTDEHGQRASIDPACRRHPGHKGIGFPDCWCPQNGLIGRLGTAEDCPQHGQPAAAPPMSRYATGGLVSGPPPAGDDGVPVCLSSGYQLPGEAVERLGGNSAVMRLLNELYVAPLRRRAGVVAVEGR